MQILKKKKQLSSWAAIKLCFMTWKSLETRKIWFPGKGWCCHNMLTGTCALGLSTAFMFQRIKQKLLISWVWLCPIGTLDAPPLHTLRFERDLTASARPWEDRQLPFKVPTLIRKGSLRILHPLVFHLAVKTEAWENEMVLLTQNYSEALWQKMEMKALWKVNSH